MVERFTFTTELAGLRLALHTALSLRAAGFSVTITPEPCHFGKLRNRLLHVEATPATRPNREGRGCNLTLTREAPGLGGS